MKPEHADGFLNSILEAETDTEYWRRIGQFYSKTFGTQGASVFVDGDRWLRRRAVRRSDYEGPHKDTARQSRKTLPFTFAEERVLHWAFETKDPESLKESTVEYIALLLQRTESEVQEEVDRRRTTKHGVKGFPI